jgi:CubicO group peptidase (beta-lactamase class C family)
LLGYDSAEVARLSVPLRRIAAAIVVSLVVLVGPRPAAQSVFFQGLTFSLFERYVDSLRVQAAIPGISALIIRDGAIVWERGFGRADIERGVDATPLTPYQIGSLSQVMGASLLLKDCVEKKFASVDDAIGLWTPSAAEPAATFAQLLGHVTPTGAYKFDLARFAAVTPAVEACSGMPYEQTVAEEIFSRLSLFDSVPGTTFATQTFDDLNMFGTNVVRYTATLARAAKGYRVDVRGRATRTDSPPARGNAATGIVSTVRDLARFDAGLRYNILISADTQARAWAPVGPGFPTGLGWFVQSYNGIPVVWQFGTVPDAFSSLMLKLPTRGLTLILLANSDGLGPAVLEKGDVTASVFARTFLRVFVP